MLYILTIFISAFLLFQVQPIIAKIILPLFGGGAAIWTTCMLFFQGFLLLGYLYAHGLSQLKNTKHQLITHGILLLGSLAIIPSSLATPSDFITSNSPLNDILMILLTSVGLPYFMLSATGPLIQRWQSLAKQQTLPYKLYSVSNIGSLLALISYPFIIEPWLTLSQQSWLWSALYIAISYIIYITHQELIHSACAPFFCKSSQEKSQTKLPIYQPSMWLLLSCVGVVLLVSTTNAMTQNIPPMPFLWVLPLCLYLLTFIICFHSPKWYIRWYWFAFFILSAFAAILMFFIGSQFDIISQTLMYAFILFSACMICHGELVHLKPDANQLTKFYLFMSLGGFLGSVLVSIFAEQWFVQFTEFPLAIISTLILFMVCVAIDKSSTRFHPALTQSGLAVSLVLLVGLFNLLNTQFNQHDVASSRNFYGLLKVVDVTVNNQKERRLIDGSTSHGTQLLDSNMDALPQSYYRKGTGAALVLEQLLPVGPAFEPMNVGLIGLGAGTLAAYGRPQEYYHFYELNPAVKTFAENHFNYLAHSKAVIDISIGDGRALLQKELQEYGSQAYDVLVIDAFSGDAIPTHLLTQQAFELYWQHLKKQGVLALHISNTHLDLKALTRTLAKNVNKQAIYIKTTAQEQELNDAEWVLITNNQQFLNSYQLKKAITPWPESSNKTLLWTDDYSNLFSVLK